MKDWKAEYEIMKQQHQEAVESAKHFQAELEKAELELQQQKSDWGFLKEKQPLSLEEMKTMAELTKEHFQLLAILPSNALREETIESIDAAIKMIYVAMKKKIEQSLGS